MKVSLSLLIPLLLRLGWTTALQAVDFEADHSELTLTTIGKCGFIYAIVVLYVVGNAV